MKAHIIPAFLEKTENSYLKKVSLLQKGQLIHLDILDRSLVPKIDSLDLDKALLGAKDFQVEVHFMTRQVEKYLKDLTDNVVTCILHQDAYFSRKDLLKAIALFKEAGHQVSLTTSPSNMLSVIDGVTQYQIMGVMPGKSGQKMLDNTIQRLVNLKQNESINDMIISVDGGVTESNSTKLIEVGATKLVMNSVLWRNPNPQKFLSEINKI